MEAQNELENERLDADDVRRLKHAANAAVAALIDDATGALRDVLNDPDAPHSVRVQAAQTVLKKIEEMRVPLDRDPTVNALMAWGADREEGR